MILRARRWLLIGALAAAGACRSLSGAPVPPAPHAVAQVAIDAPLRLDQPLTLSLRLDAAQRAALRRAPAGETRRRWSLRVEGLVGPDADVGVQVYLGLRSEAPRLDHEHRAGAFAFYPRSADAATFAVDASAVLARLRARAGADETWDVLTVTLVLVSLRGDVGHDVSVRGERVSLSLE